MTKKCLLLLAASSVAVLSARAADPIDFVKDIKPILEQNCIKCHGPDKQKGRLRFDSKEAALKGGSDGEVIIPGDAQKSEVYRRITLPPGSDDIMPSKGEPLTKAQTDRIRNWINAGAPWPDGLVLKEGGAEAVAASTGGTGVTAADLKATAAELKAMAAKLEAQAVKLEADAAKLEGTVAQTAQPAPPKIEAGPEELKAIAELEKSGVSVRLIAQNSTLREANFRPLGTNVTDEMVAPLKQMVTLVDLNLGGTKVSDRGLANLEGLTNLTHLHLERTGITGAGLAHLKDLKSLEYLNLYGTEVGDAGLESLKPLANLKHIYLWQTKVTPSGVADLQKALPGAEINMGWELTAVEKQEKTAASEEKKESDVKKDEKK